MADEYLWVEKYRPHKIEDCVLPSELKNSFKLYLERKEVPNMILSGGPGMGKTTVAKALCDELDADYIVINGSKDGNIDTLRTLIQSYAGSMSLQGGRKVVILDEADYLNPQSTQPALRGTIEEFAKNCSFIFTCNYKNRLIEPLHSRCVNFEFTVPKDESGDIKIAFAKLLTKILKKEGVPYETPVIIELVKRYFPDFRRTIGELQRYAVAGKIDSGILANLSDDRIKEVIPFLKDKNFTKLRTWVGNNTDQDPVKVMREIYDKLYEVVQKEYIPATVILLGKYVYQNAFAVDKEINLMAFLSELMLECQFK